MRRLEQALYMDRNTIPNKGNINTTSFAFEQNIKYNTRIEIQFPTFIILRVLPLKFRNYIAMPMIV
jgi:hypothetical protein